MPNSGGKRKTMAKVLMYCTRSCPYCVRAEKLLKKKNANVWKKSAPNRLPQHRLRWLPHRAKRLFHVRLRHHASRIVTMTVIVAASPSQAVVATITAALAS